MKERVNIRLSVFLLVTFCLWPMMVVAQNARLYQTEPNCKFTNTFCQDKEGFLWIGTEYGLYRFDGTDFKPYLHDENDPASLADNSVRTLYKDRDDRLWIGTANGLQYYRPESDNFQLISIHKVEANTDGFISDILQRSTGEIWFIASGLGVLRVEEGENTATRIKKSDIYSGIYLNKLCEDRHGNLWIGANRNGAFRIGIDGREKCFQFTSPVHNILEDADGRLLIVSEEAVWAWDEEHDRLSALADNDILKQPYQRATLTRDGTVYIGTYGQGLKYIPRGAVEVYAQKDIQHPSLQVDRAKIYCILEDNLGNLWMNCTGQGILMLPKMPVSFSFRNLSTIQAGCIGSIIALCRDSEGNLWCSLEDGGVFRLDASGKVTGHIRTSSPVSALYEDDEENLWAGVERTGLYLLDKSKLVLHEHLPLPGKYKIRCITGDKGRNLYLGFTGEGVLCYHIPTGTKRMLTVETTSQQADGQSGTMVNNWVSALLCDSKQRLWIGHSGGISCYDRQADRFLNFEKDSKLVRSTCYSLMEGKEGKIWMGTNQGLFRYDPERKGLTRWTMLQGLSNNTICGLAEDGEGNIWCSTMRGINQLLLRENTIIPYYTGNGLMDKTYLRGICYQSKDGTVYFCGDKGITSFDPDNIERNSFEQEVCITDMLIKGRPVTQETRSGGKSVINRELVETRNFLLSYTDNTFTFVFSTMDFREAENIIYEYRLIEFGDTWNRTLPGENRIRYNHLPPGRYTLQIRACENGMYSPVKSVSISIMPPWYQTVWAKGFYCLLLLGIAFLIYNVLKRKQQEKLNEAKLKFFTNISHEIRSPMTLIISPLESLLKKEHDPHISRMLQTMYRNANRILGLMNQLLDIRTIDKGQMRISYSSTELVGFIRELVDSFEYQAQNSNIHLELISEQAEQMVWIDRNNFDKVLVNLLSNAFKYTPQGGDIKIYISAGTDENTSSPLRHYVEISVIDSGTGINEKQLERIFDRFYQDSSKLATTPMGFGIGLNLCKSLVKLHHGTITATNRKDAQGSCFTIRIPAGNKHLKIGEISEDVVGVRRGLETHFNLSITPSEPGKRETKHRSATSYKILVVDDDEEVRHFLQTELSVYYKVMVATNGEDGLRTAVMQQPDVIISDVMMPKMDGFTLLKNLKSNMNTNHIPIILLTSKSEFSDRIESLDKGADGYIAKPFRLEELEALVTNVIGNRILLKGKFSGAQEQSGKIKPVELKSTDDVLMEKIVEFINRNIGSPELNVEMLAQEVGISRAHLHRRMKELTGMTTSDFIRNIRLKQAAKLLKKNCNVSQVAYAVGFMSQTHFSTTFKKVYGVTPKEYIGGKE